MTANDSTRFAEGMTALAETLGEPLSPARLKGYFLALEDLTIDDFERAAAAAMKRCRFFPKPIELRELLEGSPEDRAALAWSRLREAIRTAGPYQTVDFQDPALHAAVTAMGGWTDMAGRLPRMDAREEGFQRIEFCKLYSAYERRPPDRVPTALIGLHEARNSARGFLGYNRMHVIGPSGEVIEERVPALPGSSMRSLAAAVSGLGGPAPGILPVEAPSGVEGSSDISAAGLR